MSNISDLIEEFILAAIAQEKHLKISRNELANYFNCAPSQINYVLATRFTFDRGFEIISQRGGGGYISVVRLSLDEDELINNTMTRLGSEIDFQSARQLLENLRDNKLMTDEEMSVALCAVQPKSLALPFDFENKLRSQILKNVLVDLCVRKSKEGR